MISKVIKKEIQFFKKKKTKQMLFNYVLKLILTKYIIYFIVIKFYKK